MKPFYFISDLHLSPGRDVLLRRFEAFLREAREECQALYILGDLFDAWLGDDDPSPFAATVRRLLSGYGGGPPIRFLAGNRDFMIGSRFARETGVELLDEEVVLEADGRRILLMHGDQLCTDDLEYQKVRVQLRHPDFRRQALSLPIEERARLAAEYRRRSGEATSLKPADIMDVNQQAVEAAMQRHDAQVLIHGHTHRPAIHRFDLEGRPASRIVLPDWREEEPRIGVSWTPTEVAWLEA